MMVVCRAHYFAMIVFVVFGLILVTCRVESSLAGVCHMNLTYNHTWTRMEVHTYQTYCSRCPNKTKQVRYKWPKTFWEIRNKSEEICCEGYKGDPKNGWPCKAKCDSPCINGFCNTPNNCSCFVGYKMSHEQRCEPHCSKGCSHGTCLGPDICICDKGYKMSKSFICEPQCYYGCLPNEKCVRPNECQCIDGYGMSKNNVCEPQCPEGCPNGKCISPEVCDCNVGYEMSENKTCDPQCSEGCPNGECISPGVCHCNVGYQMSDNKTCDPQCSEGCPHGECISPGVCECNIGYQISENKTCDPQCSEGCPNGKCISPGVCNCNVGYQMSENKTCDPQCSEGCPNGKCISPEVCHCNVGYQMSENKTCEPRCSTECIHGVCVAPNKCICDTGYLSSNETCIPSCVYECGNGKCTEPNFCTCAPGYTNRSNFSNVDEEWIEGPICIPKCTNCDGRCIAPQLCVCHSPYIAKNVTTDGGLCDSFNAVDGLVMCYKTICMLNESTVHFETKNYGLDMDFSTTILVELADITEKTYNDDVKDLSIFGNVESTDIDANIDLALSTTDSDTYGEHIQLPSTTIGDTFMWEEENINILNHTAPEISNKDIGNLSTPVIGDKFTQEDINTTTNKPTEKKDVLKLQNDSEDKSIPLWAYIVAAVTGVLTIVFGFLYYYLRRRLQICIKSESYEVEDLNEDYNFPSIQFTGVMSMEMDLSHSNSNDNIIMECVH